MCLMGRKGCGGGGGGGGRRGAAGFMCEIPPLSQNTRSAGTRHLSFPCTLFTGSYLELQLHCSTNKSLNDAQVPECHSTYYYIVQDYKAIWPQFLSSCLQTLAG